MLKKKKLTVFTSFMRSHLDVYFETKQARNSMKQSEINENNIKNFAYKSRYIDLLNTSGFRKGAYM